MEFDTFQYPLDQQRIATHIAANRIGKMRNIHHSSNINFNQEWRKFGQYRCEDCGRFASECPSFKCHESQQQLEDRYGIYGPNCVIYLGYIKRIAIFMLLCFLVFGLPMLIINSQGSACQRSGYCITNSTRYKWSIYNILGTNPGITTQAWLWLGFTFALIIFTYYLRYYTLSTYRRINNRNTTDSDYSLILRRLPEDTHPQDIINLLNDNIQSRASQYSVRDIIMIPKQEQAMKFYQEQLQQFKDLMKDGEQHKFVFKRLQEPQEFANAAIVRFHDKKTCIDIAKTAKSSAFEKILNYICVFYKPKTQYEVRQKQISLQIAPHPTDMLWQNVGYHEYTRIVGKIIVTATALALLIISSAIALAISYWIQLIMGNKNTEPIFLTITVVIVVLIFNKLIRRKVIQLVMLYKLDNRTDEQSQQVLLIVFHESLNMGFFSVIAPILVKLPDAVSQKTTKSSSFPTVMLTTIIIQAIVATIMHFIIYHYEIKQKIRKLLHDRSCKKMTQTEASNKLKGAEVSFAKRYAFNVKMVWFGFLYGAVSPICIFVAFIGMLLSYFSERALFNSTYSIPFYSRSRINYQMIDLLDWTPLLIGLFNLFLYKTTQKQRQFQTDSTVTLIYFVMIGIGILNLLIPWNNIVKRRVHTEVSEVNFNYNPALLELTYEQSNPLTRPTPNIYYRQVNLNHPEMDANRNKDVGKPAQNRYFNYIAKNATNLLNRR